MKINYSIFAIFLLVYSCEKFDYNSGINNRQYISSSEEMKEAVTGTYAQFAGLFTNGQRRNTFICPCIFADDINYGTLYKCEGSGCDVTFDQYNAGRGFRTITENGDSVYLSEGCYLYYASHQGVRYPGIDEEWIDNFRSVLISTYRNAYKAIISLNNIINQIEGSADLDEKYASLLGEVYYMRAYSYFRLTRIFGNVPLITDTDVDYHVMRASFESIYGLIESDLKKAISLLPVTTRDNFSTICPNRGSAKALLAEVYLTMGGFPVNDPAKYELAAQYAREVIDSASIYGFSLMEDMADLYTREFTTNQEIISTVQYRSDYGYEDRERYTHVRPVFSSNELVINSSPFYAKTKFYNEYPRNYRMDITFNVERVITTTFDTVLNMLGTDTVVPLIITSCTRMPFKKGHSTNYEKYFEKEESYSIYILRYAHTLLTYAEASARFGNMDDMSIEALNMIRRRANKLPVNTPSSYDITSGLSTEEFIDSVVWERAWEFTGEVESRWFDLLRLELIENLDELNDPHEPAIPVELFQAGTYFHKLPEEDIFLNPNLADN